MITFVAFRSPGGRGVLREVFDGTTSLDNVRSQPRSEDCVIQERLFQGGDGTELSTFGQRYSGFFVPPKSSSYTFNLRSDDLSQLYLSSGMSKEELEQIINVNQYTQGR